MDGYSSPVRSIRWSSSQFGLQHTFIVASNTSLARYAPMVVASCMDAWSSDDPQLRLVVEWKPLVDTMLLGIDQESRIRRRLCEEDNALPVTWRWWSCYIMVFWHRAWEHACQHTSPSSVELPEWSHGTSWQTPWDYSSPYPLCNRVCFDITSYLLAIDRILAVALHQTSFLATKGLEES